MADRTAALRWIGHRVDDVYGGRLGKVEDVYLDGRSGEPVWLLVRLGRFGDDHVAIPVLDAVAAQTSVWVPHERQAIKSAQRLDPGSPLTRRQDLALADHYELRARRAVEIGDVAEDAVTCVSALADGARVDA